MLAVERSGPAHCSAVVCLTYSHNWHRPDISMQSELWRIKVYKWGKSAKLNANLTFLTTLEKIKINILFYSHFIVSCVQ